MDIKALGKDLNSLQSRLEKYEDLVQQGSSGPQDIQKHNIESMNYYRGEVQKVRAKYLEIIQMVKEELDRG